MHKDIKLVKCIQAILGHHEKNIQELWKRMNIELFVTYLYLHVDLLQLD